MQPYSITKNQDAIRRLFKANRHSAGNVPSLNGTTRGHKLQQATSTAGSTSLTQGATELIRLLEIAHDGAPVFDEFDDAGMRDAKSEPSMHQCALGKDIKSKISNVNGGRPGMRYYATGVD